MMLLSFWFTPVFGYSDGYENAVSAYDQRQFDIAFTRFKTLAQQGDARAQFRLSLMYSAGKGTPVDPTLALMWLRQSAKRGDAQAQSNLGVQYSRGRNVAQDVVKAYAWFTIAAMAGNRDAVTNRETVGRRMTRAQMTQAIELARTCALNNYRACD